MKAWVLHGIGDIRWENVEAPQPAKGEVLVAVKAAGICGSDIPRIYQTGAHRMPLIPGHEFAGEVVDAGTGAAASWRGQRVGAFPLIPCGNCVPCKNRRYEMCRAYGYIGSRQNGAFAEYVSVPAWNLVKLPDSVTYEEAAMLEPMAVAVHAMRRAVWTEANTVAVCGLGTIGLLLLMFLLERQNAVNTISGYAEVNSRPFPRIILAIGNKDRQRQAVQKLGLPEVCFCDSRKEDVRQWIQQRTGGQGVDVFFECVGKNETISQAIAHTAGAGQVILVGNPYSDLHLEKAVYWKILRDQLTVKGTWNSSFTGEEGDDWHYALKRLSDRRIAPSEIISHRFFPEELGAGFSIMQNKTEEYGKIMGVARTI